MSDNAFMRVMNLLSEAQMELAGRAWTEDRIARCTRASELRMALWNAIEDYRDVWVETVKEGYRCR